ncbi:AurF N-oxygenase family protein [Fodinicola acaciae]|uniref:AurF N-oxygenase family protein n=1 Tax=Fodinicola acaciae TaxID=2681555 RepID=UPI0013D42D92|nr:diiron oxygenase [Fodinicola acaciae]
MVADRETTAQRLLTGSVRRSYDPDVDIDWDAPLVEGKFFAPPKTLSLYGTPMWDRMTHEQRVELSRQQTVNAISVGIWFENILNQLLLRMTYELDPTRQHVHYALTELADECRHMTMFGKLIDRLGEKPYRQGFVLHNLGRILPFTLRGPSVWVAALIGEEIFDAIQRATMHDEELQPLVRQVMSIHVIEEARHIRYAREDTVRRMTTTTWWGREFSRIVAAVGAVLLQTVLARPEMYERAGLDVREARRAARKNPHLKQIRAEGFEKLRSFLDDNGLIGGPSRIFWHVAKVHPDGTQVRLLAN